MTNEYCQKIDQRIYTVITHTHTHTHTHKKNISLKTFEATPTTMTKWQQNKSTKVSTKIDQNYCN